MSAFPKRNAIYVKLMREIGSFMSFPFLFIPIGLRVFAATFHAVYGTFRPVWFDYLLQIGCFSWKYGGQYRKITVVICGQVDDNILKTVMNCMGYLDFAVRWPWRFMDKIVIKMVERISKKRHESLIPLFRKCLFCMIELLFSILCRWRIGLLTSTKHSFNI